jgi:aconitate hydratase
VINAFTGGIGAGQDPLDGQTRSYADIARRLAQSGTRWCAVGDDNYGEGSSREHAAMEPRYRGGLVILARSFARIHETNLKKQGVIPLTFADPAIYDTIGENDHISVLGLASLAPDAPIGCRLVRPDGSHLDFDCTHSFSSDQLDWFKSGSALNARSA